MVKRKKSIAEFGDFPTTGTDNALDLQKNTSYKKH